MQRIIGIFQSIHTAEAAVQDLVGRGMPQDSFVLLSSEAAGKPGAHAENELEKIADPGTPATGSGKTTGGTIGAAVGGAAGFTAGATAATLMVPGLGVIFAIGLGAAALLGVGGATVGAKLGHTVESEVDSGVPKEEVDFLRQLLRSGKSLVIANVRGGTEIATVREGFLKHGSQDTEQARKELGRAA